MYFGGESNADLAASYLYGIRHGVLTFLVQTKLIVSAWHDTILERGHTLKTFPVASEELKNKGYKNERVVEELIKSKLERFL